MAAPETIDEYLARVPGDMRSMLAELRKTIAAAVPEAVESISYQMPTFKYRGKPLVYFSAFKNHCSLFPASGKVVETLGKDLGDRQTSKGTIRFTVDDPLPTPLVKKILRTRMKEIDANEK